MSSISAKIAVISKVQSPKLSELLESISETMESTNLSSKEIQQLCDAIIPLVNHQIPPVCSAAISIVHNIINTNKYPKDFPMKVLVELKKTVGHHKKKPRNIALNTTNELIPIITPEVFWDFFSDTISDKNNYLKESGLILFKQTLINFPEFKTKKYIKAVFANFKDQQQFTRQHTFNIAQILYQRNPSAVEKQLKNQFSFDADPIIAKLKEESQSDVSSVSSKSDKKSSTARQYSTASYTAAMNVPQLNSTEEIESQLISDFDQNAPDAKPDSNPCPFKRLETMLKKSADWQDRMEGLTILLSHARGTQDPSWFLREMRTIQDQYSDCLSDLRAALCKYSCIVLVGLAQVFGSQLDIHSDWIIQSVFPKTNAGTLAISKAAEIAIVKYVQFVQGKHIKNLLLANAENLSLSVKLTVVKAMIVAKKFWTPSMSSEFDEILKRKAKSDKHKEVREAAIAGEDGIIYIDFNLKSTISATTKKSKIAKFSKTSTAKSNSKNDDKSSEEQETDNIDNYDANNNEDIIEATDNINNDNIVADDSSSVYNNNENIKINNNEVLTKLFEEKNTKALLDFIQNNKPDLFGKMQNVIDLIILDLNEEEGIENAAALLKEVCENYKLLVSEYIQQLLVDLPEDEKYGMECLYTLSKAFGELQMAKLLRQSNLSYASEFILNVAEKIPNDIDFQSSAVLNAIARGQYEKNHLTIFGIVKNIYDKDPVKCESLFMAMPAKEREEILEEYRYQLPTIYSFFYNDRRSDLPVLLAQELDKAKNGNQIDFNLITDVPKNNTSLLLLAIAVIRESPEFDPRFVEYLINLTESNESEIQGAVIEALKKRCETDPRCCMTIANNFVPTNAAFNSFARAIRYSDKNEAAEALLMLKDSMIEGLQNIKIKYSVLSVLANTIKFIGDEYRNFCGNLSFTNESLLNMMIAKINISNDV